MSFKPEQIEMLDSKLNPAHVKPAQRYGPKGDYIEGWLAIAEANRIFGFDGWSYDLQDLRLVAEGERKIGREQKPGHAVSYIARVRVCAGEVIRDDIGAGHGYDVDLGLAHESAAKEAVTDALKRSLRTFGNVFGLALYDKTRENVGHDAPKAPQPEPEPEPAPPAPHLPYPDNALPTEIRMIDEIRAKRFQSQFEFEEWWGAKLADAREILTLEYRKNTLAPYLRSMRAALPAGDDSGEGDR